MFLPGIRRFDRHRLQGMTVKVRVGIGCRKETETERLFVGKELVIMFNREKYIQNVLKV